MIRILVAAAGLALASPALAGASAAPVGAPAAGSHATGMMSLSLIEALAAVRQPQLAGIFSFVAEVDAPFAFADFLARDQKSLKAYLGKLGDDRKAADGLTEWDHEVCASLVNLYGLPIAATFGVPEPKRMTQINECVLAPVIPLEVLVARRKK